MSRQSKCSQSSYVLLKTFLIGMVLLFAPVLEAYTRITIIEGLKEDKTVRWTVSTSDGQPLEESTNGVSNNPSFIVPDSIVDTDDQGSYKVNLNIVASSTQYTCCTFAHTQSQSILVQLTYSATGDRLSVYSHQTGNLRYPFTQTRITGTVDDDGRLNIDIQLTMATFATIESVLNTKEGRSFVLFDLLH